MKKKKLRNSNYRSQNRIFKILETKKENCYNYIGIKKLIKPYGIYVNNSSII